MDVKLVTCVLGIMLLCSVAVSAYPQNNSEVRLDFHITWLSNQSNNTEANMITIGGQDYIGLKYNQLQIYLGYLPWEFQTINVTAPEAEPVTQNILVLKTGDDGGSMLIYGLLAALLVGILVFFLIKSS
jgi:hypothetical protein